MINTAIIAIFSMILVTVEAHTIPNVIDFNAFGKESKDYGKLKRKIVIETANGNTIGNKDWAVSFGKVTREEMIQYVSSETTVELPGMKFEVINSGIRIISYKESPVVRVYVASEGVVGPKVAYSLKQRDNK